MKYIEIIEVKVKALFVNEFAKAHGALGYLDATNFTNENRYYKIIQKTEEQKSRRLPHEAYLKYFVNDLQQEIPFWAYIDLFTIANISLLYLISEDEIRKSVANHMGLNMNKGPKILGQFMHSMTIIRNLCAHGSRIYNRVFEQRPSLNKAEQSLLIKKEDGNIDNSRFYGFFLIMKRLLLEDEFLSMKNEIILLNKKYTFVDMKYYGFRNDWKSKV